jgi:hypothetical protein
LLPDGRVLVLGGVDASGAVVSQPEMFDPATRQFREASIEALIPRAYQSATVLGDGRVLVTGGLDDRAQPVYDSELWNPTTGDVEVANARLQTPRGKHLAMLLPGGSVLLSGGFLPDGRPADGGEIFDPKTDNVRSVASPEAHALVQSLDGPQAPAIQDSTPAAEATGVRGQDPLVVRFNKRMAVTSLTGQSITLVGPAGAEPIKVVAVEQGMLAFVWPAKELLPASRYTLFVNGATDNAQRPLPMAAIGFDTAAKAAVPDGLAALFDTAPNSVGGLQPTPQEAQLDAQRSQLSAGELQILSLAEANDEAEDWVPGRENFTGRWRADRAASPLESLSPLQARPAITALSGQVLGMNGHAVPGVTLRIGGQEVRTDVTGRFLLQGLQPGFAKMEIDGVTADRSDAHYGYYAARIALKPGQTTVVPYTIWMPRLDPAGTVHIAAPTTTETIVSSPRIPGLELHIPAGTVIRDRQGKIVTELNLTAIPVDRPPFPVPDLGVPVYFTVQPGGAVLQSVTGKPAPGARLFYPNFKGEVPGARGTFWNYDPEDREWFVYGLGTISPNARQAIPDDGVVIHELTGAMFDGGNTPGPQAGPVCTAEDEGDDQCGVGGDPVSTTAS